MKKGYIQVYTGDGKGKTTSALGLALRGAGAGLKILIVQFLKKSYSSEQKALERFRDLITFKQYKTGFIRGKPTKKAISIVREGFNYAKNEMISGKYNIVILDEINIAVRKGLIDLNDLMSLIKNKPEDVELILTGRNAPEKIIEMADLVTEMKEIKHYYKKGIKARRGIEK